VTQLSKDEEATAAGEDVQVRREDQEKISRFSSLHQKEMRIEEDLRAKLVRCIPAQLPSRHESCCLTCICADFCRRRRKISRRFRGNWSWWMRRRRCRMFTPVLPYIQSPSLSPMHTTPHYITKHHIKD